MWGALFFLCNKALFATSEQKEKDSNPWRLQRMSAWLCYLIGLGPWLWIFWQEGNWIALCIELSGIPSLLLGLHLAYTRSGEDVPKGFNYFAVFGIFVGIGLSAATLGGLHSVTQFCELALALGFLYGTYRLALDKYDGYYGLMIMNAANAYLMYVQEYHFLTAQQLLSIFFVVWAFRTAKRKDKGDS